MPRFRSLRTRILVLIGAPVVATVAGLWLVAHSTATRAMEDAIAKQLSDAASVFRELLTLQENSLVDMATIIAHDPKFFATLAIPQAERGEEFAPTMVQIAREFLAITDADFLEIYGADGHRICRADLDTESMEAVERPSDAVLAALRNQVRRELFVDRGFATLAISHPVRVGPSIEAALRLGWKLDAELLADVQRLTSTEVSIAHGGQVLQHSSAKLGELHAALSSAGESIRSDPKLRDVLELGTESSAYMAIPIALEAGSPFTALLGQPLKTVMQPLIAMERDMAILAAIGLVVLLAMTLVVAMGVTRPISKVVVAAEHLERGDYDHRLDVTASDELGRLARSFASMRHALQRHVERLKEFDRLKSDFIALAGHELRTPLTVITGFNDLIRDGAYGDIPEEVRDTSEIIKSQLTRLNSQVQNILDLSSFEQGTADLQCETTDLLALIQGVVDAQSAERSDRDLQLRSELGESSVMVECDPKRIAQAFRLLLDNAVRFTPDGGSITVRIKIEEEGARLLVEDTGIGIASKQLPWIFEKFYEAQDIDRHSSGSLEFRAGGFGLGLALCQAILRAHGSRVEAESTLGRGSVFHFKLPTTSAELATAGV